MSGFSKLIIFVLVFLLGISQARLWFSDGSVSELQALSDKLMQQQAENSRLKNRNLQLQIEVESLRKAPQALEELVRSRLGYIMKEETFVQFIPKGSAFKNEKTE